MLKNILVVDDELSMQKVLSAMLQKEGYKVITANNGKEALEHFKKDSPNLVITDLKMPEMDGLTLLSEIMKVSPGVPVIMITAHGTVETAVSAMKQGAYDFIIKPFDINEIKQVVEKALNVQEKNTQNFLISPEDEDEIVGKSPKMQEVYQMIEKVSKSVATVYIRGESGTGKELAARAIHYRSDRKDKPFIKVNCAAIPENLLESELFGYEKGAFTGANVAKPGRFELADGGTLFLDEIAEMSINNQSKLFRVLQEREFERIGGVRTVKVDIRLIVATSKNLQEYVAEGKFREELYYRLNVVPISLPPLRERKEDIKALVEFFISRFSKREGKNIRGISDDALKMLMDYSWQGNIRELENVIERTVVLEDVEILQSEHFPHLKTNVETGSQKLTLKEESKKGKTETEKSLIIEALQASNGNRTKAAEALGISRRTLQLKIKEYSLNHL
ncbi:MAG: sigma-54 dependent transcriptional regulator [bacterium]|nr:sigma-54 dependent transcriptional regulator [bacterium]